MTKYTPGYRQGMLTVRWREEDYKYAVCCDCGNEYALITATQLSMGKRDCGCVERHRVYFIRARIDDEHDYMKIGRSNGNVNNRLAVAQTHFPLPLKLERVVYESEKYVQNYFRKYRIHPKREWFYFAPEMLTVSFNRDTA